MTTKYAKALLRKKQALSQDGAHSERQRSLSLELNRRLAEVDKLANAVRIPIFKEWVREEFREARAAKRDAFRIYTKPSKATAILTTVAKCL